MDGNKKSVADLYPEVKHEPTKEFGEAVIAKDAYNKALNDLIFQLKEDK